MCCRLNPNNLHFDPVLAERYKALSRREKDLLWAKDQLMMAHQLAAAQQAAASGATPADLHMMMRVREAQRRCQCHVWVLCVLFPSLAPCSSKLCCNQQQEEAIGCACVWLHPFLLFWPGMPAHMLPGNLRMEA